MATVQSSKSIGHSHYESGPTAFNTESVTKTNGQQQRSKSQKSTSGKGVHRSQGTTPGEDQNNDEEDNSADEADTEDEPKGVAPSGGLGIGKGKRPAIRVEPAEQDEAENGGAGLNLDAISATPSKKRRASVFSFLEDGENDIQQENTTDYPRKKTARKLENHANGLMAYEDVRKNSITSEEGPSEAAGERLEDTSDDDEIYNMVADIDESDNDEVLSEAAEERILKKDFELSDDESEEGEGPDVSLLLDNGFLDGDILAMQSLDDNLLGISSDHWGDMEEIVPIQSNTSTRRVRFDDQVHAVSDVDSDTSSEDLSSFFPDLFHRESHILSGSFHPGHDLDEAGYWDGSTASDSEKSYWDFGDDKETGVWTDHDVHTESESESESEAGSSGYETDEGDTTDEELPPPPTISRPARVHRDSESSASTGTATPKPFPRNKRAQPSKSNKRKGPIRGFFTLDPKRPIALVDSTGTRMVLLPAQVPDKENPLWPGSAASSTANNSPRSSFQLLNGEDSDFSDGPNPNLVDIMLSGVSGAFGGNNFPIGPPEAFYPFIDVQVDGTIVQDDDDEDEMDEVENMLDVHDFIDFGDGSSDGDETDLPTATTSPTTVNAGHTPARPSGLSAAQEMSRNMLQHFDRGVVTSFRRNQNRYRDVARLPDDPAMRASASRPVRTGASADAIITPVRRRRSNKTMGRASPLARKSGPTAGSFTSRRH